MTPVEAPRIGSLFSGASGLDLGVQAVLGGEVVWHSEIDPGACAILAHRYPGVPNLGDVSLIDWATVEPVDVLTGGFPCQDVSSAGRQAGLRAGTRSGLWAMFARAINELRPSLVVIENVRGLLSARGAAPTDELLAAWAERDHYDRVLALINRKRARAVREGKAFYVKQHTTDRLRIMGRRRRAVAAAKRADRRIVRAIGTVLGDLADLGYDAAWHGLRAADVGAPHGRYRIFILAWPTAADAESDGRLEGRTESARLVRGPHAPERGATAADTERGGLDGRTRRAGTRPARATGRTSYSYRDLSARCCRPDGDAVRQQPVAQPGGGGAAVAGLTGADTATDAGSDRRDGHAEPDLGSLSECAPAGCRDDAHRCAVRGLAEPTPPAVNWGPYEPAVERWGAVLGRPAPAPTEPGHRGGQRLAPRLTEWMMGWPDGHVTDPAIWTGWKPGAARNAQLKACGNGVVPQQSAAAVAYLLTVRASLFPVPSAPIPRREEGPAA